MTWISLVVVAAFATLIGDASGSLIHIRACPEMGVDYAGSDHWNGVLDNWEACKARCDGKYSHICGVWTFRDRDRMCYVKTQGALRDRRPFPGHVSGMKDCKEPEVVPDTDLVCSYTSGDGQTSTGGEDEKSLGKLQPEDCARGCIEAKNTDSAINGVTVDDDNNCWCERNMAKIHDEPGTKYRACFLRQAPTTVPPSPIIPTTRTFGENIPLKNPKMISEETRYNCRPDKCPASNAIDGSESTQAVTRGSQWEWWSAEMTKTAVVHTVLVWTNKYAFESGKFNRFTVETSMTGKDGEWDVCKGEFRMLRPYEPNTVACDTSREAKYVRLSIRGGQNLYLSMVKVFGTPNETPKGREPCPEMDVDYYGHDFAHGVTDSYNLCDKMCMEDPKCHAWVWLKSHKKCHLKTATFMEGRKVNQYHLVAGKKVCPPRGSEYSYGQWKDKKCKNTPIKPVGCYDLERSELLVYWRYDIEWAAHRMPHFGRSFACACHDAAKAKGYKFFATHFWGECWAMDSATQYNKVANGGDCKAADGTYGPNNKCTAAKTKQGYACLGVENYYLYEIAE